MIRKKALVPVITGVMLLGGCASNDDAAANLTTSSDPAPATTDSITMDDETMDDTVDDVTDLLDYDDSAGLGEEAAKPVDVTVDESNDDAAGNTGGTNTGATGNEKPAPEKPGNEKPAPEKPAPEKPGNEKPADEKPVDEKPAPKQPGDPKGKLPAEAKDISVQGAPDKPESYKWMHINERRIFALPRDIKLINVSKVGKDKAFEQLDDPTLPEDYLDYTLLISDTKTNPHIELQVYEQFEIASAEERQASWAENENIELFSCWEVQTRVGLAQVDVIQYEMRGKKVYSYSIWLDSADGLTTHMAFASNSLDEAQEMAEAYLNSLGDAPQQ